MEYAYISTQVMDKDGAFIFLGDTILNTETKGKHDIFHVGNLMLFFYEMYEKGNYNPEENRYMNYKVIAKTRE